MYSCIVSSLIIVSIRKELIIKKLIGDLHEVKWDPDEQACTLDKH